MKILVFLALLGLHSAAGVTHSLKYFYTGFSQVPNFPEFVAVGMVDDVQIDHYDSNTRRSELKQDWMNNATADNADYFERETHICLGRQQFFEANVEIFKQHLNHTGGAHILQRMEGCEWDDETKEVNEFCQYGYDGEDFISFDLRTETWIAPKRQAHITKQKWNNNRALNTRTKNYLTQNCPVLLKKYVNYGRSSLMRTDLPSVSLLQKTPSSRVRCHATGFYPDRFMMFWRKDGEEHHEGVELGEILPNHDGSFQMSVDLKLSSVTPEDWRRYECVFHLSGVKDDIITKLDKTVIRTNWGKTGDGRDGGSSEFPVGPVVGGVVGPLLLAAVVAGILGYIYCRRGKEKGKDGFQPVKQAADASDTSSSSSSAGEVRVEVSNA